VHGLGTLLAAHRARRERTLATVRSVVETAQRVLLRPRDGVTELEAADPAPPINLAVLVGDGYRVDVRPFHPGDRLLLYTDGVTETHDRGGRFYPLTGRIRSWALLPPRELLDHLHQDLLAHSRGNLDDDIAALVAYRHPDDSRGSFG
jgi:hypothetical protein